MLVFMVLLLSYLSKQYCLLGVTRQHHCIVSLPKMIAACHRDPSQPFGCQTARPPRLLARRGETRRLAWLLRDEKDINNLLVPSCNQPRTVSSRLSSNKSICSYGGASFVFNNPWQTNSDRVRESNWNAEQNI